MAKLSIGKSLDRNLPKEAFFRNIRVTPTLRAKFSSDFGRLTLTRTISPLTCTIAVGENVKEINVITIELKKEDAESKVLEAIAKGLPFKVIFLLKFDGRECLAVYHTKLFTTKWLDEVSEKLNLQVLDLDELWKRVVSLISGIEVRESETIDAAIERDSERQKLERQIEILESKIRKEKQFNRQIEMSGELKKMKIGLKQVK